MGRNFTLTVGAKAGQVSLSSASFSGASPVVVTATRSLFANGAIAVDWSCGGQSGTFSWTDGESGSKTANVTASGTFTLSNPRTTSGGRVPTLGTSSASVTVSGGGFTPAGDYTVEGDFVDGGTITISGSGFGTGPNVVVYADWHAGGAIDTAVSLTDTVVGQWTRYGNVAAKPLYRTGRDGGKSMAVYNPEIGGNGVMWKDGLSSFDEFFVGFDFYTGPYFGNTVENIWGAANLKWLWVHGAYGQPDTADRIFTMLAFENSSANWIYGSNNSANTIYIEPTPKITSPKWDFGGWQRTEHWVKTNSASPDTATSTGYVGFFNSLYAVQLTRNDLKNFSETSVKGWDSLVTQYFSNFNTPGSSSLLDMRMDDYYFAVGPNSAKRFVLTDAATIADSRETYICYAPSWSDTEVSVNLPYLEPGSALSGKYLFSFDENNSETLIGSFV